MGSHVSSPSPPIDISMLVPGYLPLHFSDIDEHDRLAKENPLIAT